MSDERNELPPFPIDDSTLDLIERSMTIDEDSDEDRTSLSELLDLLSEMGGSDPDASEQIDPELVGIDDPDVIVRVLRDQFYHEHDLILALIEEVRRLRAEKSTA